MNILGRLISAAVTGDAKYLSPDYGTPENNPQYGKPVIEICSDVHYVTNANAMTASEHLQGSAPLGDTSRHVVHTGHREWRIENVPWDLGGLED